MPHGRSRTCQGGPRVALMLMASTMLSGAGLAGVASAQDAAQTQAAAAPAPAASQSASTVEEVVVTAEKREENLQRVPVSIQALTTAKLEQLQVTDFRDYAAYLPSVEYRTVAPGFTNIYMRGVSSGENSNHSASLPSVGVYLDEQPVTTITGPLEIHVYDIARVEALSGPQGTLYGASSEAGTIRIITNKPDPSHFSASYDVQADTVAHGSPGYIAEGYVNIPLGDRAAIRLVGWGEHDGGYIDNVPGTRTYPTSGITINNDAIAKNNYNDVNTIGGRAALKIDLDDNWSITPTVMGQQERSNGVFGYDPNIGKLEVTHFFPEFSHDSWMQAAMTVQGKIANFDVTYAGAYMHRTVNSQSDYTDYAFYYDTLAGYGAYFYDNAGNLIDPSQHIIAQDRYAKESQELRIASPKDNRFRVTAGLFWERQTHAIHQDYRVDGLADSLTVPGHPDTLWLTEQKRIDRDYAAFAETSFDITSKLTLTAGARAFDATNSLYGFYGFGSGFSGSTGVSQCFGPPTTPNAPCTNLNKTTDATGETHKFNLTYQIDPDRMIYATYSTGFRPGGVNRKGDLPPYLPDFLTNYEAGWKTSWLQHRLRWNGAVFWENWNDFQFSFLGSNGLTVIKNAGQARIKGVETDITLVPMEGLTLTGAGTYIDAKLTQPYCGTTDDQGNPITDCASPLSPAGTPLPVTPKLKGNLQARYEWQPVDAFRAHVQGAVVYQGSSSTDLRLIEAGIQGRQRAFATADFTVGVEHANWSIDLYIKNAFDNLGDIYRYSECATQVCGATTYIVPTVPRLIGIEFGQKF